MQKKILIVEDDLNLGVLLLDLLQEENYMAQLCKDGLAGLQKAEKENFDLCILDVMMPKMDGFSLAQTLRNNGHQTPFVFLTAKSMIEDRLKGYDIGAEDYVSKPFHPEELLCKIKVILNRHSSPSTNPSKEAQEFTIGAYTFQYETQLLTINGNSQRLTQKESEVLRLLCLHKNQVLKREDAVLEIYGKKDYFLGRSFDVFISKIRKLLKQDASVRIETVFKVGFTLISN